MSIIRGRYSIKDTNYLKKVLHKVENGEITLEYLCKKLNRDRSSIRHKLYKLGFKGLGHVRELNEYVVYKGEDILAIGTMQEIADELGINKSSVSFYGSPSNINATSEDNARRLVKLD